MLRALRRHRARRRRAQQDPSGTPAAEPQAESSGDDSQTTSPHDEAPLAELLLTEVLDPFDARADVDLASISGVAVVPLRVSDQSSVPRELPAIEDPRDRITHAAIFGSLAIDTLDELKRQVGVQAVREGHFVFREGEPSDALFVVARGAVVPQAGGAPAVRLSVLGEGDCFGEVGLLTGSPRTASVRALVDSEVLVLDRALLDRLIQRDSALLATLTESMRERIVDRLLKTSALFASLDRTKRTELVREFRLIEVGHGAQLIEQGVPAPAFFLILSGAVRVLCSDESGTAGGSRDKELAVLGPGGFVGEMSLLQHAPAVASVTALGSCWMLALPRSRFETLLSRGPELTQHLNSVALMRHHQNHLALRKPTPAHGRVDLF